MFRLFVLLTILVHVVFGETASICFASASVGVYSLWAYWAFRRSVAEAQRLVKGGE
jgi:hypothetical protein